jgi:HAD superfamily hydrolase (TIGR01484 family)
MIRSNDSIDDTNKKKNSHTGKLIRAIFSDYDGTLCSASAARDTSLGQNRIPQEIREVLQQIAEQIPICIISSKDYSFIKETRAFARVISCLMGIETLIFDNNTPDPTTTSAEQEQPPSIQRKLLMEEKESDLLSAQSYALEDIAKSIESHKELRNIILLERKHTSDMRILVGITVDWRNTTNWDYYRKRVQSIVSTAITNLSQPSEPRVYLYLKEYNFHPFLDLYVKECNKGTAFDTTLSQICDTDVHEAEQDIYVKNECNSRFIKAQDVLYLGDSENDNPAFRRAGVSIGVRSDPRIIPKLECQHTVNFDSLARFLRKLKDNHLVFNEDQLGSE